MPVKLIALAVAAFLLAFAYTHTQVRAGPEGLKLEELYQGEMQLIESMLGLTQYFPNGDERLGPLENEYFYPNNADLAARLARELPRLKTQGDRLDYLEKEYERAMSREDEIRALEKSGFVKAEFHAIDAVKRSQNHLLALIEYHKRHLFAKTIPGAYEWRDGVIDGRQIINPEGRGGGLPRTNKKEFDSNLKAARTLWNQMKEYARRSAKAARERKEANEARAAVKREQPEARKAGSKDKGKSPQATSKGEFPPIDPEDLAELEAARRKMEQEQAAARQAAGEAEDKVVSIPRNISRPGEQEDKAEKSEFDLQVKKTVVGSCRKGLTCRFKITITNNGPANYSGPVSIADNVSLSPGWLKQTSGFAACTRSGTAVNCLTKPFNLSARQSVSFDLDMQLPITDDTKNVRNCAKIVWPDSYSGPQSSPDVVHAVQTALKRRGLFPSLADGKLGASTLKAIKEARKQSGLKPKAGIDRDLLKALFGNSAAFAGDREPANDRACLVIDLGGGDRQDTVKAPSDKPDAATTTVDLNGRWMSDHQGAGRAWYYLIRQDGTRISGIVQDAGPKLKRMANNIVSCMTGKQAFTGTIAGDEVRIKFDNSPILSCYPASTAKYIVEGRRSVTLRIAEDGKRLPHKSGLNRRFNLVRSVQGAN